MNWVSGILVFFVIWWCVLFAVLPWGNRAPDEAEAGHADSAPVKPRLGLKMAITTLITIVLWGIAFYLIQSGIFSFRDMVTQ
jgi:predicted secreted protein